ncbi:MAG: NADH-quinone oxidoreductase subunit C [Dehalococcoidales bacterium]
MTVSLSTQQVSAQLSERFPDAVLETGVDSILLDSAALVDVAAFLKDTPGLDFDFLSMVSGVDYYQYFEVVYHLISLEHNHSLTIKTRCRGRDNPTLPSLTGLWRSADLQEREIYDLLGVSFEGHPNLTRIVLWPEFSGHPLRKDYL